MKWLIILAFAAAYAALILITWVHYKKSRWPPEPPTPTKFERLGALARRASTTIIAMFAWIWPVSKRLWAWPKRSKNRFLKKAVKAVLIAAAAIVLLYVLAIVLSLAGKLAADWSLDYVIHGTPTVEVAAQDDSSPTRPELSFGGSKTTALFISFFATIVLTFTLIRRAAKKDKENTTPGAEKKYDETKPKEAAPKKASNFGWLRTAFTILVLAGLSLVVWKIILPMITNTTPMMARTTIASQGYPICASARDTTLTPKNRITKIRVQMNPSCWSGWIATPADWPDYYFQAVENRGMEIWFLDGTRRWLEPNSFPWFPNKRGIFRVRGEGGLIVSIEGGRRRRS